MFNVYLHGKASISKENLEKLNDFDINPCVKDGEPAGTLGEHDVVAVLEAFNDSLISIQENNFIINIQETL